MFPYVSYAQPVSVTPDLLSNNPFYDSVHSKGVIDLFYLFIYHFK